MNKVTIRGNLTEDPKVLKTAEGKEVGISMRVATSEIGVRSEDGPEQRRAFHPVTVFSETARGLLLKKGALVEVTGRLRTRAYELNGEQHYSTGIVTSPTQVNLDPSPRDNINQVRLIGNLATDPVLTNGPNGPAVRLRLVTNPTMKDAATGEYKPVIGRDGKPISEGHNIVAHGQVADQATEFSAGGWVEIHGHMRNSVFSKDGREHPVYQIVADEVAAGPRARLSQQQSVSAEAGGQVPEGLVEADPEGAADDFNLDPEDDFHPSM